MRSGERIVGYAALFDIDSGLVCGYVGLFCRYVGLFCGFIGLFYKYVGLFGRYVGLFCGYAARGCVCGGRHRCRAASMLVNTVLFRKHSPF